MAWAFWVYKFRSMFIDAETRARCSRRRDEPEVHPVAVPVPDDELLDIWNVLKGPRPELLEQFKQQFPQYMLRHKLSVSGITGLVQLRLARSPSN